MSRGKGGFFAGLAAVAAVSAFLMVGCGGDGGGEDDKDGKNPVTNDPNNNNNTDPNNNNNNKNNNNNNNNNNGGNSGGTVKIDGKTWMAKILDVETADSWCYGEGGPVYVCDDKGDCSEKTLSAAEIQSNCAAYGRLYTWAAAMNLPSSCNSGDCSDQIQTPHQGACPAGWHIPTRAETDERPVAVAAAAGQG
jgi:hypothetical protein